MKQGLNVEQQIYTIDEAASILKVSRTTIKRLIKANKFKYHMIGGHYRISKRSFNKWLEGDED